MSDELISRKTVIDIIENKRLLAGKHDLSAEYKLAEVQEQIEELPIAYDVDKVIEQLEERKKYLLKNFVLADKAEEVKERTMARINEIDGLIEIVKSGGVADE